MSDPAQPQPAADSARDTERREAGLRPAEPGTFDQWWPASDDSTPLVSMVVLGVAHHQATGHMCGGGNTRFDCAECDLLIEDGVVIEGGWVRFKNEGDPDLPNDLTEVQHWLGGEPVDDPDA